MKKIQQVLKECDIFLKVPEKLKITTNTTKLFSVISYIIIGLLVFSETYNFLNPQWVSHVDVDTVKAGVLPNMYINIDITFPKMKCDDFGLDVTEITGSLQLGVTDGIKFDNRLLGGCRMHGTMKVSRVSGEFHVAFGKISFRQGRLNQFITATQKHTQGHIHQFTIQEMKSFNPTHYINHLSFSNTLGSTVHSGETPLNGKEFTLNGFDNARKTYYINVIPTLFKYPSYTLRTYQLSVSERDIPVTYGASFAQPGVFFKYELSPYIVINEMNDHSFAHSLASVGAIVGGVLIIIGWLSKLFDSNRELVTSVVEME
ncbi:hypothetical protein, conserved [Entamoeba dispar SAW760]|uniref:Endoplasmic reticulum-Golgi intermediate compartment protein n=1 Tax=Entamoeba dispar (strain ATCC PRA-260 / SAW760) TaxID=370354 RepID=B0EDD0_ENTDS|nr:uncharacterized protein EDI_093380 [Entamoeba dispar SAW760]EDR27547.1 hypothetical protein, conserved [Entamoeba dispar SAW760]|eukprot:EDR27547.1 hypothetical protein, conserved [Entamoeba dispar SAW760]